MSNQTNSDKSWERIKNVSIFISLLFSILAIVLNTSKLPEAITSFWGTMNEYVAPEKVQRVINVGNILVSFCFLILFRSKRLQAGYKIDWDEKTHAFCDLAEIPDYKDAHGRLYRATREKLKGFETRVDTLVKQYLWLMFLFALSLVILYLFIILTPGWTQKLPNRYIGFFPIITNIANFIEGIIVFLAFRVLYSETLDPNVKDNRFWQIPSGLALLYVLVILVLSMAFESWDEPHTQFLNVFDLIAGSVNGLAMFLLFGRYVSLEQSLKGTKLFADAFRDLFKRLHIIEAKKPYTRAVSFGIIFVLPFYALAQPLFGSLYIDLYGSAVNFQTTVYAICLVGKLCFFYLTYLLIRNKLLHLYLYGLISEVGNFSKLEQCLTSVVEPRAPKVKTVPGEALEPNAS